ncbi:MAG: hypothetical protein H0X45_10250, partial [Planctomycetes bacterium]|nr:hypothetical protein [Planctomycetota bacterium]
MRDLPSRLILIAVLATGLLGALDAAVEPIVATTWEVRRDAKEMFDEIAGAAVGSPALYERAQALL